MNKYLAIGLTACLIPTVLAAEDPGAEYELNVSGGSILVLEESAPVANDLLCARSATDKAGSDCMIAHRAVLTARLQKVSLKERGRWM